MSFFAGFRAIAERALLQEMWGIFEVTSGPDPTAPEIGQAAAAVLLPGSNVFWADPFYLDDQTLVVEQLDFRLGYGRIFLVPLSDPTEAWPILDDGVHASYPFVVRTDGETLVVPERARNRRMEIYRWDKTSTRLELVEVALEGFGVTDPTLYFDETINMWFLFFLDDSHDIVSTLRLFVAPSLSGPWHEHPSSPVANTPRGARPAGALYHDGDRLFRIGQDCGQTYGGAIITFEVHEFTQREYVEESIGRTVSAVPGYAYGVHTFNTSPDGARSVIDAKRMAVVSSDRSLALDRARHIARRAIALQRRTLNR